MAIAFRDHQLLLTAPKEKWAVSISALKQLTKCSQQLIERVIDSRREEIDAHHAAHELGRFQNSKGKFAPSIVEVLNTVTSNH